MLNYTRLLNHAEDSRCEASPSVSVSPTEERVYFMIELLPSCLQGGFLIIKTPFGEANL